MANNAPRCNSIIAPPTISYHRSHERVGNSSKVRRTFIAPITNTSKPSIHNRDGIELNRTFR